MGPYTKAIVTAIAAVLAALSAQIGQGDLDGIDGEGWVRVGVVLLGGTAFTWFAENVPGVAGGIIKAALGAGTALLTALSAAYENDGVVTQGEWLTALSLALAALATVYQLRNVPPAGA